MKIKKKKKEKKVVAKEKATTQRQNFKSSQSQSPKNPRQAELNSLCEMQMKNKRKQARNQLSWLLASRVMKMSCPCSPL